MSDMFSMDSSNKGNEANLKELQEFLTREKALAEYQQQVHEFNDVCWDKCVDRPGIKLDSKTETCIKNCVNRFIDVSAFVTNRFAQILEKSSSRLN